MLETILLSTLASGHGTMVHPPIWLTRSPDWPAAYSGCYEAGCMWFTNLTFIADADRTMAADSEMRTYGFSDPDWSTNVTSQGTNPWAAPGKAKVFSPCGIYGGNPLGCPVGDTNSAGELCWAGGYGYGVDMLNTYTELSGVLTTEVEQGGVLEAAYSVMANHGGGYSYRLCKTPEDGDMTKLTEECFQAGHLDYASDHSYMQLGANTDARIKFDATRSAEGTTPSGSVWTKNPIAPCADDRGGLLDEDDNCANSAIRHGQRTQFEPKLEGMQGFGEHNHDGAVGYPAYSWAADMAETFPFVIVDELAIPSDLEPGKYVLGWRWDCESTSQIWTMCSNIEVTAK